MNRAFVVAALAAVLPLSALSADPALIKVWPGVAPGSESWTQVQQDTKAVWGERIVRNVVSPTLEVFLPDAASASGAAVLICPGGAFRFLTIDSEGTALAQFLNGKGIAAFLLRYRLGETVASDTLFMGQVFGILAPLFRPGPALLDDMKKYGPPAIADGRESMKLLRSRAKEFAIDASRVGVVGFSAGGVVGTALSIDADAAVRPDFFGAIYPGPWPVDEVPEGAPPVFLAAANDDGITASGAKPLEAAWRAASRPIEAHYYETGGHGFGMKKQNKASDAWPDQFIAWLGAQGFLKKPG